MAVHENFLKAPPEKQLDVINAGLICFGRDGYAKTAMSEIAAEAGVSKAALFHYFGSKRALYLHLFRFCSEEIAKNMVQGTDDLFECLWLGSETKMRVMAKYPAMYDFMLSIVKEDDKDLMAELRACNVEDVERATALLFGKVNWGKLKPEVDRQTAIQLVTYVSGGCIRDHAADPPDVISANLKKFMDLLKTAIYKEEYL